MTPYEAVTGLKPILNGMHKFGNHCFAYATTHGKLDARAEQCIFIGYDRESPAYLVYYPDECKVRRVRIVSFTDKPNIRVNKPEMYVEVPLRDIQVQHNVKPPGVSREILTTEEQPKAEATSNSVPESEEGNKQDLSDARMDADSSNTDRYPKRKNQGVAPQWLEDYVQLSDCSTTVDYCYKGGFVPQTYEEAKNC